MNELEMPDATQSLEEYLMAEAICINIFKKIKKSCFGFHCDLHTNVSYLIFFYVFGNFY